MKKQRPSFKFKIIDGNQEQGYKKPLTPVDRVPMRTDAKDAIPTGSTKLATY